MSGLFSNGSEVNGLLVLPLHNLSCVFLFYALFQLEQGNMSDTRNHFGFCSNFLLLLLCSYREENIFASVPIVQVLIEQADDFCLCFEKGLRLYLLPYNGYLCSGLD